MSEESGLAARLHRLEGEVAMLRYVVARLASSADPRARIAIVKALTGAPASLATPDGPAATPELAAAARSLLSMISK